MFPSFHALSYTWFFFLLVPLILFYFLKLKRPRVNIPSLVLWQQVLADSRVNSPFQKFKKHLLLLLQILLLTGALLAAMQPFFKGSDGNANIPILIDVSASMGAETKKGTTVLDEVKEKVREIIDGLLPGQKACIITFGSSADKRTSFTDNKKLLHDELDRIHPLHVESDTENVLRLVQALSKSVRIERVRLFSDGNLPSKAEFGLSFFIDYFRIGEPGPNTGITALSAERAGEKSWALLVKLTGAATGGGAGEVEILQDGRIIASEVYSIGAQTEQDMIFEIEGEQASSVTVKNNPAGRDSLVSDNTAYIELPAPRPLAVYASPSLYPFRRALSNMKGIHLFTSDEADGAYDLAFTDKDDDIDASSRMYVGLIPKSLRTRIEIKEKGDEIVDWNRHDPLLKYVSLHDLVLLKQPVSEKGFGESGFENLGYRVLIHGTGGPLMVRTMESGYNDYYMIFNPAESTLPYRVAFPVMVSNMVSLARFRAGLSEVSATRTGILPELKFSMGDTVAVISPSGERAEFGPLEQEVLSGAAAWEAGEYIVELNGKKAGRIGVSLLSGNETGCSRSETLEFNEGLTVGAADEGVKEDKPFWAVVALITFLLMLAEWWYFHKPAAASAG